MDVKMKSILDEFLMDKRTNAGDSFLVGGKHYGVFYRNKKVHIAEYKPYKKPPRKALCGHDSDLWNSFFLEECGLRGSEKCSICFELLEKLAKFENE